MRQSEEILDELKKAGEELPIPKSLTPERMRDTLKVYAGMKRRRKRRQIVSAMGAAACFCLTMGAVLGLSGRLNQSRANEQTPAYEEASEEESNMDMASEQAASDVPGAESTDAKDRDNVDIPVMTYDEIYERLSRIWEQEASYVRSYGVEEAVAEAEAAPITDLQNLQKEAMSSDKLESKLEAADQAYGTTNVQVESVDEADQIKNDGRYLYQIAWKTPGQSGDSGETDEKKWGIQILDTKNGLKEAAFLTDFNQIEEFYVWNDLLIAVENKYLAESYSVPRDMSACYGGPAGDTYHEISIYDMKDRTSPKKVKTFTLQGVYESSRISDGYFYGISQFTAKTSGDVKNRASYIPTLDGKVMEENRIYCPRDSEGTSYLVLVSIDLENPSQFADSRAVLCGSGTYYVSQNHIYVGEYHSVYNDETEQEGTKSDRTEILKFSYEKGKISVASRGEIPGQLEGSFSLDEYDGYLRAVATVQEYQVKKVTDERTGEDLGYDFGNRKTTNALYVLDQGLRIQGKIDGLAENEMIYSARFLGERAYFVTFRQTDPLFAADLSDPENPTLLGELKVTGFSEYLHPWSGDLLLGIGQEADPQTGATSCMKLSMFDLSDPAQIKETGKLLLDDYNYSAALSDHRAVLIDVQKNLIGFTAEGSDRGDYWKDYVLYGYEDGAFVRKLKVNTHDDDGYYEVRGTYIKDVLYLLKENGTAQAYDLNTGELLEEV